MAECWNASAGAHHDERAVRVADRGALGGPKTTALWSMADGLLTGGMGAAYLLPAMHS